MVLKTPYGEYRITQGFGTNPAWYKKFGMNGHNGIDLAGLSKNYCIKEGDFVSSGFDSAGYGNYVKIRDSEGNEWTYAHFKHPVSARGHISMWQDLGEMGMTGFATGVHVHITKKPKNPNYNNGFKGAVDFTEYINYLNNPPPAPAPTPEPIKPPKEEECMTCKRHTNLHNRYTLRVSDDINNRKYFVTSNGEGKKDRWDVTDAELLEVIEYFDREIIVQPENTITGSWNKHVGNWSMITAIHKRPELALVEGQELLK